MAGNDSGDVLMRIIGADGKAIPAECLTQLNGDDEDDLTSDFVRGTFFEIDDFDFGINIEDRDDSENKEQKNTSTNGKTTTTTTSTAPKSKSKFSRWMSMKVGTTGSIDKDGGYPVELEPFSFTRQMDKASPIFFHACSNKLTLKSAVVVKRKDIGSSAGLQAYLRLDFTDLLMISIGWDNGIIVKEKCKFICRQVIVQYRPQAHNGVLGPVIAGSWERKLETMQR